MKTRGKRLALGLVPPQVQISSGLNLTLELKDPHDMLKLLLRIRSMRDKTNAALSELHFVHFARFLPTRDNKALLVITEFDGDLEPYVMDFAASIGDVFSAILEFVKDAPPLPVQEHPQEFWTFVQKNNRVFGGCIHPWPLYSSYPKKTVLDILGPREDLPPPYVDATPSSIDFEDVQGNILRGYHTHFARHFALEIVDAKLARRFLAALLSGNHAAAPQITTAADWGDHRPEYFLNLGITAAGLRAIGVPAQGLALFPVAFQEGPAAKNRADKNGDVDGSAPAHWILGQPGQPVHLLVSLCADADKKQVFDDRSVQLRGLWPQSGLRELSSHDAEALPGDKVHFGYTEGMGQPRIAGVPDKNGTADMQPQASVGEFLLGANYLSVYGGRSIGDLPAALAQNATFAAVRILKQDVRGFEKLLHDESARHGLHPEEVAAKLMGRWRNGDPLTLVPSMPAQWPAPSTPASDFNKFDYAPTPAHPGNVNDFDGSVCPVGSHMRRMNPRAGRVAGKPYSRRIIRRGLPYEAELAPDASKPAEKQVEQGLFGMFMCADLERQFEFLMQIWANGDIAASGIRGTQDPIVGTQAMGGRFHVPVKGSPDPIELSLPRLVETRGSLYLFVPGIKGLQQIAALPDAEDPINAPVSAPMIMSTSSFDPDQFDLKDPAFLENPYPTFALFRRHAPVHYIDNAKYHGYKSYWVFTHDLVTEVCEDRDLFLKKPKGQTGDRGLFFMDPPRHGEIRSMLNPLFAQAIASAPSIAEGITDQALLEATASGQEIELISAFAKRVPRDVFMTVFGVPPERRLDVGSWADTMLAYYDRTLPPLQRALKAGPSAVKLDAYLRSLRAGCPAHSAAGLMCLMKEHAEPLGMTVGEVIWTAQNFALGGYLSTEFLIATGVYNLLRDNGAAMKVLQANPELLGNAIAEMLRYDAPFQMADRYAARDTALGGVAIPADSMVTVIYGSANRDENVFPDPDRFDITRVPNPENYAFGHGDHHCIGASLVDIVAPIAFRKLLAALPNLRLGSERPMWLTDPYFRSFSRLSLPF